tara:strand:+ start:17954 stop:18682 length:729 start_codon:yes stop_codon:yes gene_type:complete
MVRTSHRKPEGLEILYEDNHLLVVVKPPGILSQEDASGDPDVLSILKRYIKESRNKPRNVFVGLVHRLDRATGGIMVLALTSKAAARLSEDFQKSRVTKKYIAVVNRSLDETLAILPGKSGELSDRYRKDERSRMAVACEADHPDAKEARLLFSVLGDLSGSKHTALEVELLTGRFHQIRYQLASRGLPLAGEAKYADQGLADFRLGLWSYRLEIRHPVGQRELKVFEKLPSSRWWRDILQG